ncbi:MAG: 4-hydroxy-tetrahydrodipicolinate reductase [Lentisphaerae bacterium]|nr:4-hydroxy-tetrahydrodipicolinate reductase [Lentisphaerota bacterium]MCP4103469.1 4-hydroxy-tetrahydrodipicolinate reductase [Lentisphaerota bacterium]
MLKVAVIGAAGRMGRRLTANITAAEDMTLSGAVEISVCPLLGQDAGVIAGIGETGIKLTDDIASAVKDADAIIDFSTGDVAKTAQTAIANGSAVIIGTTALPKEQRTELEKLAGKGGRIVLASNMSVGVNLLFHMCKEVAGILGEDYDIEIVEMHHNQKKDAPSGTAVSLGEAVCEGRGLEYDKAVVHGREGMVGARTKNEVGMHAVRGGDVVGDHTVIFATGGERIELTHKASSRDTFAKGALRAVRFLSTVSPGLYNMQDVLKLK